VPEEFLNILGLDQGHRRGNGTALEDILRLCEIDLGSSSNSEPTGEDVVLHVGDFVLMRDDEEFVVIRVSRRVHAGGELDVREQSSHRPYPHRYLPQQRWEMRWLCLASQKINIFI